MYTKTHIIGAFVIGICLAITAGAVYMVYGVSKQTAVNTQTINQIVNFINANSKQSS